MRALLAVVLFVTSALAGSSAAAGPSNPAGSASVETPVAAAAYADRFALGLRAAGLPNLAGEPAAIVADWVRAAARIDAAGGAIISVGANGAFAYGRGGRASLEWANEGTSPMILLEVVGPSGPVLRRELTGSGGGLREGVGYPATRRGDATAKGWRETTTSYVRAGRRWLGHEQRSFSPDATWARDHSLGEVRDLLVLPSGRVERIPASLAARISQAAPGYAGRRPLLDASPRGPESRKPPAKGRAMRSHTSPQQRPGPKQRPRRGR